MKSELNVTSVVNSPSLGIQVVCESTNTLRNFVKKPTQPKVTARLRQQGKYLTTIVDELDETYELSQLFLNGWEAMYSFTKILCPCGNIAEKRQRQNTAYVDDKLNWVTLCTRCLEENDEHWRDMWEDYNSGRG